MLLFKISYKPNKKVNQSMFIIWGLNSLATWFCERELTEPIMDAPWSWIIEIGGQKHTEAPKPTMMENNYMPFRGKSCSRYICSYYTSAQEGIWENKRKNNHQS